MLKDRQGLKKLLLRFFRGFLVLCVLLTYGGGSAVIQGVAWVTMIPTQVLSTGSLEDGLKNTFNGEHACSLCELASELRDDQQELPIAPSEPEKSKKLDSKEKTTGQLLSAMQLRVNSSLILISRETLYRLTRVQLDVEVPPPDFV